MMKKKALVVFSGGQDSTTCLQLALKKFKNVFALSFDYGQRHKQELLQAKKIARKLKIPHEIIKIDLFSNLSNNALTQHRVKIDAGNKKKLPSTFVPGRNLIFLSIAAMKAYQLGVSDIVTGVCQTDYSGYPDCRDEFIRSLETTLHLGLQKKIKIHTPLMWLTKAETVKLMQQLGGLELLKLSHTCYEGRRPACGKCPACLLRLKGFREAGIMDPLKYTS